MLGPLPRRAHGVRIPVSSSVSSAFPQRGLGRLPASLREYDFSRGVFSRLQTFSLCSGLRVCLSPRSFLPLLKVPQGSRDFYIRAERASLPPHAPDMLAVRIQAIDGTRTSTLLDSQPCRPLPTPHGPAFLSPPASYYDYRAAVSIATGWSEPVPGQELHPLKSSAFHGALLRQLWGYRYVSCWATRRRLALRSRHASKANITTPHNVDERGGRNDNQEPN